MDALRSAVSAIFGCGLGMDRCSRGFRPLEPLSPRSLTRCRDPVEARIATTPILSTFLIPFDAYFCPVDWGIPSPVLLLPTQKLRFYLRLWVILSHRQGGKEEGPAAAAYMGRRTDAGEASGGSRRKPSVEISFLSCEEVPSSSSPTFACRL